MKKTPLEIVRLFRSELPDMKPKQPGYYGAMERMGRIPRPRETDPSTVRYLARAARRQPR